MLGAGAPYLSAATVVLAGFPFRAWKGLKVPSAGRPARGRHGTAEGHALPSHLAGCLARLPIAVCPGWDVRAKPFFSGLDTLPRGRGCLPAFLKILGALSGITPPPPPGGGRPRVGWDFLGKIFVNKIFIFPLSGGLPDLFSTLAVVRYICGPEVLGWNPGRQGIKADTCRRLNQAEILPGNRFKVKYLFHCIACGFILGRYCGQGGEWVPASLTPPPPLPRVRVGLKQCLPRKSACVLQDFTPPTPPPVSQKRFGRGSANAARPRCDALAHRPDKGRRGQSSIVARQVKNWKCGEGGPRSNIHCVNEELARAIHK